MAYESPESRGKGVGFRRSGARLSGREDEGDILLRFGLLLFG
jgi:hypothetical protein